MLVLPHCYPPTPFLFFSSSSSLLSTPLTYTCTLDVHWERKEETEGRRGSNVLLAWMALGSCRSAASDLQLPVAGTVLCGGLDNCSGLADNNQFACRSHCQNSVADCRIEGADARQNHCGRTPNLVGTSVHACTEHTDFHDGVVVGWVSGGYLGESAWDRWGICNYMSCLPPFSTNTVRALLLAAVQRTSSLLHRLR